MGAHGAGDQAQTSHQQNQHHDGVKERGRLEIDMHVGDDTGQDEEGSGYGEQPSDSAAAVEEQNPHAEEQRDERDAEAVAAPEAPVRTHYRNLIRNQVAADADHNEADEEFTQTAGGAAYVGKGTVVVHGRRITKSQAQRNTYHRDTEARRKASTPRMTRINAKTTRN